MYIYKFTHLETGRCYIGQTIQDPNQRRLEHINHAKYSTKEYHFHNALRKYGIDSFLFEVIDTATSLDALNFLEEFYVKKFDSINNGYNIRNPGGNKLHSKESKRRMSEAQKVSHARRRENGTEGGWKRSDGGPMNGKKFSAEHKERLSNSTKGRFKNSTWKLIDGKRVWITKEKDNSILL